MLNVTNAFYTLRINRKNYKIHNKKVTNWFIDVMLKRKKREEGVEGIYIDVVYHSGFGPE